MPKEKDVSFVICNNYDTLGVSQVALVVNNLPADVGDSRHIGSIPGSGSSLEKGMVTHSTILDKEIPWIRGAWRIIVHRDAKSWTQLK